MTSQLFTNALLLQVMSPAKRIWLTDHHEAYTHQHPCYYQPSASPKTFSDSLSTTIANLFPVSMIPQFTEMISNSSQNSNKITLIATQTVNSINLTTLIGIKPREPSNQLRPNEVSIRKPPVILQAPSSTRPAAYSPHLTPNPSILRPLLQRSLACTRVRCWVTRLI